MRAFIAANWRYWVGIAAPVQAYLMTWPLPWYARVLLGWALGEVVLWAIPHYRRWVRP